jgi:hypothetical protein
MDVQARALDVLKECAPGALTAATIADELGVDVRTAGRALFELARLRHAQRLRTRPNTYTARELR